VGKAEPELFDELAPFGETEWTRRIDEVGGVIVACNDEGEILGYCYRATPSRDADEPQGVAEIAELNVDARAYRQGLGRRLLAESLDRIRADGWRECSVWTLDDNERSLPLYEQFGFVRDGAHKTYDRWFIPDVRLRVTL
jgi:predicted N-acetyltransferase YhbS